MFSKEAIQLFCNVFLIEIHYLDGIEKEIITAVRWWSSASLQTPTLKKELQNRVTRENLGKFCWLCYLTHLKRKVIMSILHWGFLGWYFFKVTQGSQRSTYLRCCSHFHAWLFKNWWMINRTPTSTWPCDLAHAFFSRKRSM